MIVNLTQLGLGPWVTQNNLYGHINVGFRNYDGYFSTFLTVIDLLMNCENNNMKQLSLLDKFYKMSDIMSILQVS